jgi:hypothetical protein
MKQKYNSGLTRKQIINLTGVPYYTLTHLRLTNKLPIIKHPRGSGDKTIYHQDAVKIIEEYLSDMMVQK